MWRFNISSNLLLHHYNHSFHCSYLYNVLYNVYIWFPGRKNGLLSQPEGGNSHEMFQRIDPTTNIFRLPGNRYIQICIVFTIGPHFYLSLCCTFLLINHIKQQDIEKETIQDWSSRSVMHMSFYEVDGCKM